MSTTRSSWQPCRCRSGSTTCSGRRSRAHSRRSFRRPSPRTTRTRRRAFRPGRSARRRLHRSMQPSLRTYAAATCSSWPRRTAPRSSRRRTRSTCWRSRSTERSRRMHLPVAADFAAPPGARRRRAWDEADRAARPARLARLRARLPADGIDAYFGLGREEIRYLTGVALADGEDKVAGHSGRFLVSAEAVVVLADSRYTLQARREAPDSRVEAVTYDLTARWAELLSLIHISEPTRLGM